LRSSLSYKEIDAQYTLRISYGVPCITPEVKLFWITAWVSCNWFIQAKF